MKRDKLVTIFSGFNQRAVIAFIRTLEKNNISYAIIACTNEDPILKTSYNHRVLAIRKIASLNLTDITKCIYILKKTASSIWIAPSTEALNRFLLEHKKHFNKLQCEIPLVDKDLYEEISNKYSFSQLCKSNKILVPMEYDNLDKVQIPYVAKPISYAKDKNLSPILVFDLAQHNKFISENNHSDYYYQKYIKGESYYLLYYFSKNKKVFKFSQENLIQQPQGKHILAAVSANIHTAPISRKFEKMFKNKKFHGLVMIEVKFQNNKYYMIEANPRFWGPSQLFVDSKVNLFEHQLTDYQLGKIKIESKKNKQTRYFWSGGINEVNKNNLSCDYYNYTEKKFNRDLPKWNEIDIYNREDTKQLYIDEWWHPSQTQKFSKEDVKKLLSLYKKDGKHSNYQALPLELIRLLGINTSPLINRHEKERFEYISNKISLKNKSILDIGGNTGFFTFESLSKSAKSVCFYEGNINHAKFVSLASSILGLNNKVIIKNRYFKFNRNIMAPVDIVYLLNVLHHVGDDYGDKKITITEAKSTILRQLNTLASKTKILIFQLGYNWKGNKDHCLFDNGTKKEMIDFIRNGTKRYWKIKKIGIAKKIDNKIKYCDINSTNIERDDSLGEFLNRPIFILESVQ